MIRIATVLCCLVIVGHACGEDSIDEPEIMQVDREHWAYVPVVRPDVPTCKSTDWPKTDIDQFILAQLENKSLSPSQRANRTTLLRRLSLDLTGLPPTLEQVLAFTSDDRPGAYRRLVDQLLASPEYGKHWGQHWLDLARFAETDGYEHDEIRPTAWRYRDWLINALNHDMPYNRFVRLQIAGDHLGSDSSGEIATAFCLSGPDMPDINSQDERKHVLLNEITSTVGAVFFSLQVGCAQCHDHKYDAISQADFYRLRAYFDSSITLKKKETVTVLKPIKNFGSSHLMERGDWRSEGPRVRFSVPRVIASKDFVRKKSVPRRVELANWLSSPKHPITARSIVNRIWQYHFGRGLVGTPSDFGVMGDEPTHPLLLDFLADELVRNEWSLKHLHRQIVLSAVYQTESGQANDSSDPQNRLLRHFPRQRLDGEVIRDCLYAVSDSLCSEVGGPGVSPPLPPELIKTLKPGQWKASKREADHYRRSIYIFARRNLRYPFFSTFDRPAANQSCPDRSRSTTAVQSLSLMNSDITLDAASRLSRVISKQSKNQSEQIDQLFVRAYSRNVKPGELTTCKKFLSEQSRLIQNKSSKQTAALTELCRAILNSNEFVYID